MIESLETSLSWLAAESVSPSAGPYDLKAADEPDPPPFDDGDEVVSTSKDDPKFGVGIVASIVDDGAIVLWLDGLAHESFNDLENAR